MPLPVEFPGLIVSSQLISINVSEEVSVKDLLIEIGKLSDINLDINPKISGNIILKLKDKNINKVIQSIADSAKLRYSTSNGVIKLSRIYHTHKLLCRFHQYSTFCSEQFYR